MITRKITCTVCDGVGRIDVVDENSYQETTVRCPQCNGEGILEFNDPEIFFDLTIAEDELEALHKLHRMEGLALTRLICTELLRRRLLSKELVYQHSNSSIAISRLGRLVLAYTAYPARVSITVEKRSNEL